MTHIEVVREALTYNGRDSAGFEEALAALDSLEAELAHLRKTLAPDGIDGHPCIRVEAYIGMQARLKQAEAELAQERENFDRMRRIAMEATVERDQAEAELAQVREERDAAQARARYWNDFVNKAPTVVEAARYREALERIAAFDHRMDTWRNVQAQEAIDLARAALTEETEPQHFTPYTDNADNYVGSAGAEHVTEETTDD